MNKTLIIEDNDTFRQTLRDLLSSRFSDMTIEVASDGREILKKINAFRPDLIFMDIKLPGENGLELTKKIKSYCSHVTIIILTSYDFPEYREAARLHGANSFVSKGSTTADEILALVESIFSGPAKAKMTGKEGIDSEKSS